MPREFLDPNELLIAVYESSMCESNQYVVASHYQEDVRPHFMYYLLIDSWAPVDACSEPDGGECDCTVSARFR